MMPRLVRVALGLLLLSGCIRDERSACPAGDARYLRMSFRTGEIRPVSRVDDHDSGLPEEAALRHLQVWVFGRTGGGAIGYKEISGQELSAIVDSYGEVTLTIEVDRSRIGPSGLIDIYVAANAPSAGVELSTEALPEQLETAVMRSFSPEEPVSGVPPGGLPIARVVRGIDANACLSTAYGSAPALRIPLVRSVSKMSFFLVFPDGLQDCSVQEIRLDGGGICRDEYFFPGPVAYSEAIPEPSEANVSPSGGYHAPALSLLPLGSDICYCPDPAVLVRSAGEDIEDYVARLRGASVRPFGTMYLKESDRALSGTVYYTMASTGTQLRQARFSLDAGLFVRNHEWIVYAYFSKDRLYVRPEIAPWTDGGTFSFDWNYASVLVNQTGNENTRILTEGATDYVMCAYGSGPDGLPCSPKLQLTGSATIPDRASLRLLLDNPDFGFVQDEGGVLSPVRNHISMELGPAAETITFYVVPKTLFDLAGPNPANPVAKLRLLLTSSNLASVGLPFNTVGLPGDTDFILYHYVTPDKFR